MSNELKPCPCCGPKAFIIPTTKCDPPIDEHCWTAKLRCHECGLNISRSDATEKEALHEAIEAWNTRAERTCHSVSASSNFFRCSECGCEIMFTVDGWKPLYMGRVNYCPNCGAKVVE